MKKLLYLMMAVPFLALGQSANQNYVKQVLYKQPTSTIITSPTPTQASVGITYFDGLGRPIQQVAHKQSANEKDIATPILYDEFGRQTRDYLPVPLMTSNMDYTSETTLFFTSPTNYYSTYGNDALYLYSEKRLEASPLNRILEQGAPGQDWVVNPTSDTDHTIKFDYLANTDNEVKLFKATATWVEATGLYSIALVNGTGTVFYPKGQLYKTVTKDENWTSGKLNTTEEYKNKKGQVVLKRTYNLIENTVTAHDTYYVYDQFGNLTYVVPPLATGSITSKLDGLCYQYKYDYRNRMVEKKLPGKQWEFIVYDKLDRVAATGPVLSPFGTGSKGWLVTRYDRLNRQALTGWYQASTITSATRKTLQDSYTATTESLVKGSSTVDNIAVGYASTTFPTGFKLLTADYYDDYAYPNAPTVFSVLLDNVEQVHFNATDKKPKGLATGSWVRVLSSATSTAGEASYTLYDKKGRPVRSYKTNHLGGYTYIDIKLDFTGKALYMITYHKRFQGGNEISKKEEFTYTSQGQLLTHEHLITFPGASIPKELLTRNEYDHLGQLISKRIGGPALNPVCVQKVDYSYTIRGWLKGINDIDNLMQGNTDPLNPKDLFAFKLNYNTVENTLGNTVSALYNGNISETFWRTSSDNVKRKYGYIYDGLNRLIEAVYHKPHASNPALDNITNAYNEEMSYDRNGNILKLTRNGYLDGNASSTYEIDNLDYVYGTNSNELQRVNDMSNSWDGFKDGQNPDPGKPDYGYDSNGNMVLDWNKGIMKVAYNHLNLPTKVAYDTNEYKKITYLYNARGVKVEKIVDDHTVSPTVYQKTEYLDGFQYSNEALQYFPTSEGYVSVTSGNRFDYVYNYTDHLGNIRLSYSRPQTGVTTILEENHYYPFGMKHINYGMDKNRYVLNPDKTPMYAVLEPVERSNYQYKYNGKELQDELGLNMTAMDFRQHDNAIGRFNSIDALSEVQYSETPYHFGYNNPIYWADPTGLISGKAIAGMWNATANGTDSYWYNNGSGMTSDDLGGGKGGNVDFATGEFTSFESLGEVTISRANYYSVGRGLGLAEKIKDHAYSESSFYQHVRDERLAKRWSDFGQGLQDTGDIVSGIGYVLTASVVFAEIGVPLAAMGNGISLAGTAVSTTVAVHQAFKGKDVSKNAFKIGKAIVVVGTGRVAEHYLNKVPGLKPTLQNVDGEEVMNLGNKILQQNVSLKLMGIDRFIDSKTN